MSTYDVTFAVKGRFVISVEADSEDEADDYASRVWDALNPYIVQSEYEIDVIDITLCADEDGE